MKSKNPPKSASRNPKNALLRKFRGKTKTIKITKQGIRHQMRGVEERKYEAYKYYDEYLKDEGNEADGALGRVLVGVDEAGRGPLAGPVSIGVAVVPSGFDWNTIPGVGDSKKVSPKNREAIFRRAKVLKKEGKLDYAISLISNNTIDRIGITKAVALGIERCFKKLALDPKNTEVKLDGLLRAPDVFKKQETIIKGDGKEKVIGLASILAKVTRDQYMSKLSGNYLKYDFHIHKGYGTLAHRTALKKHGLTKIHRKSFCKKFLNN